MCLPFERFERFINFGYLRIHSWVEEGMPCLGVLGAPHLTQISFYGKCKAAKICEEIREREGGRERERERERGREGGRERERSFFPVLTQAAQICEKECLAAPGENFLVQKQLSDLIYTTHATSLYVTLFQQFIHNNNSNNN